MLGSTEWAETHAAELKQKVLVYINSDGNGRGFLGVGGSHRLPASGERGRRRRDRSGDRRLRRAAAAREDAHGDALEPDAKRARQGRGQDRGRPEQGFPHRARWARARTIPRFLRASGLAALDVGYGGEGESGGVYHSALRHLRASQPLRRSGLRLCTPCWPRPSGALVLRMADADAARAALRRFRRHGRDAISTR